jgi:plasmid maintenance system killer protein
MTSDERAQLIEDIKKSAKMRLDIIERAQLSEDFDIAAAWETLDELDDSIEQRVVKAGVKA